MLTAEEYSRLYVTICIFFLEDFFDCPFSAQYFYIFVLLTLSFMENPGIVVGLYIASSIFAGGKASGCMVNSVDLSPRFASSLSGIANGTGQIIAILAPLLVQYMVTDRVSMVNQSNIPSK